MQERVPQPEDYVFSTALRYEFPLLLTLSSKRFLDWPRKRVREWMQKYTFFSDLQGNVFSAHPYHYCALVSDCEDDYKSVAKRYERLSNMPLSDLSDEHVRVFKLMVPEDFHITNRNGFLSLQKDYALLVELTPKLWNEVLDNDWRRSILPIIEAKATEMCYMLRRYPIKRFIEEYTRIDYETKINVHPSWAQFGGMVFYEQGKPAISIEIHEEERNWFLHSFIHESLHCLENQERLFRDEAISDLIRKITERLKKREVEVSPHYEFGLNYVSEALTEALNLRILNLNVDSSFNIEKFQILQSLLYQALINVHEGTKKALVDTLPDILGWVILRL